LTKKSKEEQLEALEQKLEQIKARKQKIEAQLREKERKERTRRLIQVGAIFEKYFDIHSVEEAEAMAAKFSEEVKKSKQEIAVSKDQS
jgi:multidrug resistance efflux pump